MKNLIPLAYLNEACFLSLNEDDKRYQMILKLAQESLRDLLGGEFYEEIETQYSATANTLTADNLTLYKNHIKDFLAWQCYANYLGFSQTSPTPTGVREFTDENSELASDLKMFSLEKNVERWKNHYKYQMINFLTLEQSKNTTKYPKYKGGCKEEFSWGITSIHRNSTRDNMISVNRAVRDNE